MIATTFLCLCLCLLLSFGAALRPPPRARCASPQCPLLQKPARPSLRSVRLNLAEQDTSRFDSNSLAAVGLTGVLSNVVCDYSLYVLKTTSCGLPPGPFGLLGAAEGISYLVVVGIFAWSAVNKVKTGAGLPAGPAGLLGLAEGLTFLTVLGGLVIAGLNLSEFGFLPGFLPNDKCFGIN
ncbi:hypothetical protein B484DRAFT_457465 [Ochromonadaceae sp. CCMP2298]|nr:hypothetical protein B484DRAFT_457465 [Ochromonadaceae sp. CCMP2298]|mmetsp:Transcript_27314/g.60466  ORF Transcript_27314/g.60466 Transcript_27314/m.60466 type:complete len:180 (-) Transcript_27314:189-728(-)